MPALIGLYIFVWFMMVFISGLIYFVEENKKTGARLFLASFPWPVVAVYMVARYGRTFITKTIETAELHEFVIQEQDVWQGSDSPPVGKEKR